MNELIGLDPVWKIPHSEFGDIPFQGQFLLRDKVGIPFLLLDPSPTDTLRVLLGFREDSMYDRESRQEDCKITILTGKGFLIRGGELALYRPGDCYIIPAYTLHCFSLVEKTTTIVREEYFPDARRTVLEKILRSRSF